MGRPINQELRVRGGLRSASRTIIDVDVKSSWLIIWMDSCLIVKCVVLSEQAIPNPDQPEFREDGKYQQNTLQPAFRQLDDSCLQYAKAEDDHSGTQPGTEL